MTHPTNDCHLTPTILTEKRKLPIYCNETNKNFYEWQNDATGVFTTFQKKTIVNKPAIDTCVRLCGQKQWHYHAFRKKKETKPFSTIVIRSHDEAMVVIFLGFLHNDY